MDEAKGDTYKLLVEGDDLLSVMSTVGQCFFFNSVNASELDIDF